MVEFYTKWCRFCQLLSPEYDRLVDILKETRKDVIIGRLEADMNDITRTKYGINQFPILALFMPNSKRIVGVYQGNRQAVDIANWINQNCPKIEIKEDEEKADNKEEKNDKNESLEIDMETINKKNELTSKNEFIKEKFFEIKKRLDEIDKKIENITNTKEKDLKNKEKKYKHKKLRITFDFTTTNIFLSGITLLIIFAFYQTGRKLLIN